MVRLSGGRADVPALAPAALDDLAPLDTPLTEEFRVGTLSLTSVAITGNSSSGVGGGLALSDVKHRFEFSDTFASATESASASTTVGWTVGGGIELMMCRNWTMKAEYLYVDFGKDSASGVVVNTVAPQISFPTLAHEADLTTQIARAGINYKF